MIFHTQPTQSEPATELKLQQRPPHNYFLLNNSYISASGYWQATGLASEWLSTGRLVRLSTLN